MTHDSDTHAQLAEYLRLNPDATAVEAVGHAGADPSRWVDPVRDALAADTPHAALSAPGDTDGRTDTPEHGEEDPAPARAAPWDPGAGPAAAPAEPHDACARPRPTPTSPGGR